MALEHALEAMGVSGAIISALLAAVSALASANVFQYLQANKVYKYRLAERDTLNKALTDASKVLADMLKVTEERNEINEEQAELISKQAAAFTLLEATVAMQFNTIKDYNSQSMDNFRAAAQAVAAMASSIQQLHQLVLENRISIAEHVQGIRNEVQSARQAIITEMKQLIGTDATVVVRRRVTDSRPSKRPSK